MQPKDDTLICIEAHEGPLGPDWQLIDVILQSLDIQVGADERVFFSWAYTSVCEAIFPHMQNLKLTSPEFIVEQIHA